MERTARLNNREDGAVSRTRATVWLCAGLCTWLRTGLCTGIALALPGATGGCDRSTDQTKTTARPIQTGVVIDFPADLPPDDPAVTAFVRKVIDTCVAGDYNAFRLLWSIKEDPFPRDSFQRGWRAVRRVSVVRLQKFRRRVEGDIVYGLHAHVELDPAVPKPRRDVILLIVREDDHWRLRRAPSDLRRRYLGNPDAPDADVTAPAAPDPDALDVDPREPDAPPMTPTPPTAPSASQPTTTPGDGTPAQGPSDS